MTAHFSKAGIGKMLAESFEQALNSNLPKFPSVHKRGETLMMVADFGGQHKGQVFDTYAFLALDLERNRDWMLGQQVFRQRIMANRRRMAFKAMNDRNRRQSLIPFLDLADGIEGCLVLFGISKAGGSLFGEQDNSAEKDELLTKWKPNVRERLLRIIHLSGFLLSGLSAPDQDVMWFIDKDEIAANEDQLTQLTEVFARVSGHSLSHDLRHLRCGTTQSDNGTLMLEDLVSICDLGAGALSEVATAMIKQDRFPRRGIVNPLPTGLTWKTRVLSTWLAADSGSLRRVTCLIELDDKSQKIRSTKMKWHAFASDLWLQKNPLSPP